MAEAKESNNVETLLAQTVVQDVSKVPLFIVESPEPQKIQPVKGKQIMVLSFVLFCCDLRKKIVLLA